MPRNIDPTPFVIHPPEDLVRRHPELHRLSHVLAELYAAGNMVVSEEQLQAMGSALWSLLDVQEEFDAAQKDAGAAILPVIIESSAAEVQALPWETLYHPVQGFIGRHPAFTLTRRIQAGKPAQAKLDQGPLRVLLFTSLPEIEYLEDYIKTSQETRPTLGRLNVEEEQAQVQEALLPWIFRGLVQLEMPDDGRFSTLKDWLKRFDPHILFLSGHGMFHHEPHSGAAPYGEFLFENEIGAGEPIRDEQIAKALVGTRLQVVVLSACESGKAASDSLSSGLMQRISAQGTPHVIGMRESIFDTAGIQFARTLCNELAQRERIDFAMQAARIAIQAPKQDTSPRMGSGVAGAELSRDQWCLPMMLSPDSQAPLIDWDFQPKEVQARLLNQRIDTVSLPARFVGRRAELRRYKSSLLQGAAKNLLITGPGGQGKTALAGKLALDLRHALGYEIFAWSARPENPWREFEFGMEMVLDAERAKKYDYFLPRFGSDLERARFMLKELSEQFNGRLILFFDNLETLQAADSLAVSDANVAAWIQAACAAEGVIVLATSRSQIPNWQGGHLSLGRASYGDFLQIAQGLALQKKLSIERGQLRRLWEALGGNSRGLEFFAGVSQSLQDENAEAAFLKRLEQTRTELQANMAIAEIVRRLPAGARQLLARLPAYHEAVPEEGLLKLALDLPEAETALERLRSVSLVETSYAPRWQAIEYQCTPMVTDWLEENGLTDDSLKWFNAAADYHLYLYTRERGTLAQAITTHHALLRTGRHAEADRLALDDIVYPLTLAGFYTTLLTEWLPGICASQDLHTRGQALGQTGKLLISIGDYETALSYLKQSLAIRQQIGDKAGEGATLNNISQIYDAQGDYETALSYLKQSLVIMQQIGDKAGEGATLNNISQIYDAQGDYETALSYLKQSLAIRLQIGDKAGEGATLNNISQIYDAQGDYETALSYLKQSLAIMQQIGDKAGEGATLNNISALYHAQGDYETALSYLKQSLAIMQQIGDKAGEGATLNNISQIYDAQGDYETALSYLKQSLAIRQQIGDKAGEGTTLNNISALYHAQGDYETALSYLKGSLAIAQQIGDKAGEGATLNNISALYHAQGDYETALSYLKQSLAIAQQIGDKAGEGATLNNISQIFKAQGDYETALSYLKQSLAIRQQIGDKAGEGTTLNNISALYHAQGDYETALSYLKQSLAIRLQIGDKAGEGTTLNNISALYHAQGDYETALSYLKQSLAIRLQIGDKAGEGTTLNNISALYHAQGDYETALSYLKQSLAIRQQIGDKAGLCATLFNMGHIHAQNDQIQQAASAWVTAYVIAKQINDFQVLQALSKLAPQLGLPEGLEGWEALARQFQDTAGEGAPQAD